MPGRGLVGRASYPAMSLPSVRSALGGEKHLFVGWSALLFTVGMALRCPSRQPLLASSRMVDSGCSASYHSTNL
jgi:hypothetical protein